MNNVKRARKPSKTKAPAGKKRQDNPIADLLSGMDDDVVAMIRNALFEEMGLARDTRDPADLFNDYLEGCSQGRSDEEEHAELLASLVAEFSDLQIDSNGGDRDAREMIEVIHDMLDDAIEQESLRPFDLMMIAKVFSDAGWIVPDSLKEAMGEALRAARSGPQVDTGSDLRGAVLALIAHAGENPFDIHESLTGLLAGFPPEASVVLLAELIAARQPMVRQAVVGYVLHRDDALAQAVTEALAASAAETPVESSMIERLVRIRPWLPQPRQAHLDAAIRKMRLNALPPTRMELPKALKCHVSTCDGSGTRCLFVTQKTGARYQLASVMMKVSGVTEALLLRSLSRSDLDDMVAELTSSAPAGETDLGGFARSLALAVADNVASGNPPPFRLVEVMESLGLGPVHPDHASPMDIISALLAELPPEQTDRHSVARAHADLLDSEITHHWFEAGEAVEDLLFPVRGSRKRIAKLLNVYLPGRRSFWVRQCALSALAMRGAGKTSNGPWKQLALIGRDLASDMPLDQIPLMKQVATLSVEAFEDQL